MAARVFAASHLTGTFVLRSGRTADHYFDKYRFESDPALLAEIVAALVPLVPEGTEGLAGLELGGVPLATMLSSVTGLPAFFVRKQPKKYGTEQVCEGGEVAGRPSSSLRTSSRRAGRWCCRPRTSVPRAPWSSTPSA